MNANRNKILLTFWFVVRITWAKAWNALSRVPITFKYSVNVSCHWFYDFWCFLVYRAHLCSFFESICIREWVLRFLCSWSTLCKLKKIIYNIFIVFWERILNNFCFGELISIFFMSQAIATLKIRTCLFSVLKVWILTYIKFSWFLFIFIQLFWHELMWCIKVSYHNDDLIKNYLYGFLSFVFWFFVIWPIHLIMNMSAFRLLLL